MKNVGRPPLGPDEMLTKIKSIISNLLFIRSSNYAKMAVLIAVRNGVLSARYPEKVAKNGGSITLSTKWAQNVLKLLDCGKWRGTITKK